MKLSWVDTCPKCGGSVETGFGLAYGGYGSYQYCEAEGCGWFEKERICASCEGVGEHYPDCHKPEQL